MLPTHTAEVLAREMSGACQTETLLRMLDRDGENLASLAHDARNMVTALELYCDLLQEPGVLTPEFGHYGVELRVLAAASRRLVEKLSHLPAMPQPGWEEPPAPPTRREIARGRSGRSLAAPGVLPETPVGDLAFELETGHGLLSALAGPSVEVCLDIDGAALPVQLSNEDLTRILVNLLKNAVEAMPGGGRLLLTLREMPRPIGRGPEHRLLLTVEDNGPGIAPELLERIFEPGFTAHGVADAARRGWEGHHRGLGLAITRSIVESAGGTIRATRSAPSGACFRIELPVRGD